MTTPTTAIVHAVGPFTISPAQPAAVQVPTGIGTVSAVALQNLSPYPCIVTTDSVPGDWLAPWQARTFPCRINSQVQVQPQALAGASGAGVLLGTFYTDTQEPLSEPLVGVGSVSVAGSISTVQGETLIATIPAGTSLTTVNLPANTQTLRVFGTQVDIVTAGGFAQPNFTRARGTTSNLRYPFQIQQAPPSGAAGGVPGAVAVIPVDPTVDGTIELAFTLNTASPVYVVATLAVEQVATAGAETGPWGVSGNLPAVACLLGGYYPTNTEMLPVLVDSSGHLLEVLADPDTSLASAGPATITGNMATWLGPTAGTGTTAYVSLVVIELDVTAVSVAGAVTIKSASGSNLFSSQVNAACQKVVPLTYPRKLALAAGASGTLEIVTPSGISVTGTVSVQFTYSTAP